MKAHWSFLVLLLESDEGKGKITYNTPQILFSRKSDGKGTRVGRMLSEVERVGVLGLEEQSDKIFSVSGISLMLAAIN